jgi:hypothetical protein
MPGNVGGYVSPTRNSYATANIHLNRKAVQAVRHIGHANGRCELGMCYRVFRYKCTSVSDKPAEVTAKAVDGGNRFLWLLESEEKFYFGFRN